MRLPHVALLAPLLLAGPLSAGDECPGFFAFDPARTVDAAANPTGIAAADLDGDGRPDLALACRDADAVALLRQTKEGTFVPWTILPAANVPRTMAAGDLDGDGRIDLVAACDDVVLVRFMNEGGGAFRRIDHPAPSQAWAGIADVDADGDCDIVYAAQGTPGALVLLRNERTGFAAAGAWTLGSYPRHGAFGDLDGDGRLDLVVVNLVSGTLSILRGNAGGTFDPPVHKSVPQGPRSVALADLDGDGVLDVALANKTTDRVAVLFGDGNGGFVFDQLYMASPAPHAIAACDFDGDGAIDLVAGHVTGAADARLDFYRNDGTGSFRRLALAAPALAADVVATDLDGDGIADVATANTNDASATILIGRTPQGGVPCLGDATGDADVGFDDLLEVIGYWGACADESSCNADLDYDCTVGLGDLLIVLARWGPCP